MHTYQSLLFGAVGCGEEKKEEESCRSDSDHYLRRCTVGTSWPLVEKGNSIFPASSSRGNSLLRYNVLVLRGCAALIHNFSDLELQNENMLFARFQGFFF